MTVVQASIDKCRQIGRQAIGPEPCAGPISSPYCSLRRGDDSGLGPHDRNRAFEDHLPGVRGTPKLRLPEVVRFRL
jgi:hypothetical protein